MSVRPSLHHVALGTHDVSALAAFYCGLLETSELRRQFDAGGDLRSVWLDLSGTILMIERAQARAERPRVEGVGLGPFLLAFRTNSLERRGLVLRAEALGGRLENESRYTSYLRDPDGNRIAVSEYEVSS